jgi:hypothetical protein
MRTRGGAVHCINCSITKVPELIKANLGTIYYIIKPTLYATSGIDQLKDRVSPYT